MKRLAARFFLIAALALGSVMVAPPAEAQRGEGIPIERVDRDLRETLMRALRRAGVEIGGEVSVMVSVADCPSSCNGRVASGMCYCGEDENGRCGQGQTHRPNEVPGKRCSIKPDTAAVMGGGMREPMQFLLD